MTCSFRCSCCDLVPLEHVHLSHLVKQTRCQTKGSRVQINHSWHAWMYPEVNFSGSLNAHFLHYSCSTLLPNQTAALTYQSDLTKRLSWQKYWDSFLIMCILDYGMAQTSNTYATASLRTDVTSSQCSWSITSPVAVNNFKSWWVFDI